MRTNIISGRPLVEEEKHERLDADGDRHRGLLDHRNVPGLETKELGLRSTTRKLTGGDKK
jgi:hypothetical protein